MGVATLAVAAFFVLCVTYVLFEPDFWQHLLVGKVIGQTRGVPGAEVWTWPGAVPGEITPSWLFRALVWPLWSAGGVWGLFLWRWTTTLAAFGLAWATARRMGVRGFAALAVLVLCAMAYRTRSQIRPETLVAVLIALEIWLLEVRRRGGPDRSLWLLPVAWVWANAHISYYLGFLILGAYLVDDALRARRGGRAERARLGRLAWVALAAAAVSFLNPFGWQALWQPFDYALHMRNEPLFRAIDELKPMHWRDNVGNGLLLLVGGWPLLVLRRVRHRAADPVDVILCVSFTALALSARRFFGFYAIVAAPFVMRDLDAWLAERRWRHRLSSPWLRAGAVVALSVALARGEWTRIDPRLGIAIDDRYFPIRACDFIAEHGIRGRSFHPFHTGGYLLHRFWPDRDRLPFMDIHQTGGPELRLLYMRALERPEGWQALDRRFAFDYVLLDRRRDPRSPLLDFLDDDPAWAMVFTDDAAALYLRREGPYAGLVERFAYRHLPGGQARIAALGEACARDDALRAEVRRELERQVAGSPWHSTALSLLANVATMEGRYADARALLGRGLRIQPLLGRAHERLGRIALHEGRPREALREFQRERAREPKRPGLALLMGRAWQGLGDRGRAAAWYRRELRLDPGSEEARDSLRAIGERAGD